MEWGRSAWLVLLALTVVTACGSRSSLLERGARWDASGSGGGGDAVGVGGKASGDGGAASGSEASSVGTGGGTPIGSGGSATGGLGGIVGVGGVGGGGSGGTGSGGTGSGGTCSGASCCGDGNLESFEHCDDGNRSDGDDCPADCSFEVLQLTGGRNHLCALLSSGRIKCWGAGGDGQLGLGDPESRGNDPNEMGVALPALDLGAGHTARRVDGGQYHTCAVLGDDAVKCWGRSVRGQLGLGDSVTRGDDPDEMGDALPNVDLGSGRRAKDISVGAEHSCALLDDGSVKCWGWNVVGQLGLGDVADRGDAANEMGDALPTVLLGSGRSAKALAVGSYHTCVLLDDETVKCWGQNSSGQLGLGDADTRGDDANELGDALPAVDLGLGRTAKAVAAGASATCALLDDDSIKCWGSNGSGQLGLGYDTAPLGDEPNELGDALPAVDLGTGRSVRQLAVGLMYACALLDDETLKCWGQNEQGELGLGDEQHRGDAANQMGDALPVVDLGTPFLSTALAAGGFQTCALESGGSVKCWGSNQHGELGLGDVEDRGDEPGEMGDELPAIDLW